MGDRRSSRSLAAALSHSDYPSTKGARGYDGERVPLGDADADIAPKLYLRAPSVVATSTLGDRSKRAGDRDERLFAVPGRDRHVAAVLYEGAAPLGVVVAVRVAGLPFLDCYGARGDVRPELWRVWGGQLLDGGGARGVAVDELNAVDRLLVAGACRQRADSGELVPVGLRACRQPAARDGRVLRRPVRAHGDAATAAAAFLQARRTDDAAVTREVGRGEVA